jgi:glycosyltransferase involved in cell wall biosynthesis
MKTLLSHPTGNQNFRQVGAALHAHGMLGRAATCLNWNPNGWLAHRLPAGARAELARRSFVEPWAAGMATRPGREAARLVATRVGWRSAVAQETGWCSVDAVYHDFDRWLARNLPMWQRTHALDAVYAYEDGALAQFEAAKELGLRCAYDLPIAYWSTGRRLMAEEAERLPNWAATLGSGVAASAEKLERKRRELELAEIVVVPSQFVADSLPPSCRSKRVVVAQFGSPRSGPAEDPSTQLRADGERRPLRVLFAGLMGQRKGLGDLFAAMRLLKRSDVELVVLGSLAAPMEFYRSELSNFTFEPGRPHDQVLNLMRTCDVLALPSIVEGRALVMQEAMSQGLPIIITPNTGGADLIEEGKTGFLVPIRNPAAIAGKIAWLADHREAIPEMSRAAQVKAATYTWENYGNTVVTAIRELECGKTPAAK